VPTDFVHEKWGVGAAVGAGLGPFVVGDCVGFVVGATVGVVVGMCDGTKDGTTVALLGAIVGVGETGDKVGETGADVFDPRTIPTSAHIKTMKVARIALATRTPFRAPPGSGDFSSAAKRWTS
jgi:hypothetical protein